MPWDLDADVQVMEADMYFLAAYYNMSTYYYKYDQAPKGRYFRLEVNPHFRHREPDDVLNVIDARWIDMENGLFIDITAARYDIRHKKGEGILYDKNGHQFRVRSTKLFPRLSLLMIGRIPTSSPCSTPHSRGSPPRSLTNIATCLPPSMERRL